MIFFRFCNQIIIAVGYSVIITICHEQDYPVISTDITFQLLQSGMDTRCSICSGIRSPSIIIFKLIKAFLNLIQIICQRSDKFIFGYKRYQASGIPACCHFINKLLRKRQTQAFWIIICHTCRTIQYKSNG